MKRRLNKRERLGTIVLLLGIIGLAVDRLLLPQPSSAAASQAARPKRLGVELPAIASLRAAASATRPAVTREITDVFALSRLGLSAEKGESPGRAPDDKSVRVAEFASSHSLKATVMGPRPIALVDERTMRVGDALDGFRLESIQRNEAVFVLDGQRVALHLRTRETSP